MDAADAAVGFRELVAPDQLGAHVGRWTAQIVLVRAAEYDLRRLRHGHLAGTAPYSDTRPALTSIEPSHTAPVVLHIDLGQFVMCWDELWRKIDLLDAVSADDEQERASIDEGSMPALVEQEEEALVVEILGG